MSNPIDIIAFKNPSSVAKISFLEIPLIGPVKEVLKFLDFRSLLRFSSTCKTYVHLSKNIHLWEYFIIRDFGCEFLPQDKKSMSAAYHIHHLITLNLISHSPTTLSFANQKIEVCHLIKALRQALSIRDERQKSLALIGHWEHFETKYCHDHANPLERWQVAEKELLPIQDGYLKCHALLVIADGFRKDKSSIHAKRVLKDATELALTISSDEKKSELLTMISYHHCIDRDYILAEEVIHLIPEETKKINSLIQIANHYKDIHDLEQAERIFTHALTIANKIAVKAKKDPLLSFLFQQIFKELIYLAEIYLEDNQLMHVERIAMLLPENASDEILKNLVEKYLFIGDFSAAKNIASLISNAILKDELLTRINHINLMTKTRKRKTS
jgi:hypothetical protein